MPPFKHTISQNVPGTSSAKRTIKAVEEPPRKKKVAIMKSNVLSNDDQLEEDIGKRGTSSIDFSNNSRVMHTIRMEDMETAEPRFQKDETVHFPSSSRTSSQRKSFVNTTSDSEGSSTRPVSFDTNRRTMSSGSVFGDANRVKTGSSKHNLLTSPAHEMRRLPKCKRGPSTSKIKMNGKNPSQETHEATEDVKPKLTSSKDILKTLYSNIGSWDLPDTSKIVKEMTASANQSGFKAVLVPNVIVLLSRTVNFLRKIPPTMEDSPNAIKLEVVFRVFKLIASDLKPFYGFFPELVELNESMKNGLKVLERSDTKILFENLKKILRQWNLSLSPS